ncbi:MAG: acetate uptake transporter [Frankiaceae bacterium]
MSSTVDPGYERSGAPVDRAIPADPTQHIANPAPLGLAAFALTTFVLSVINTGMLDAKTEPVVLGLAAFYGGGAQLLAGMWEFRKANTFGATAFSSYGAFWLAYWFLVRFTTFPDNVPGNSTEHAVATFLLGWTIFTAYMTVASLRVSGAVAAVFVFLTLTFAALTIGNYATSSGWVKLGGWLGIITAAFAWYASFAGVTNETWKRTILPTWQAPTLPARTGAPATSAPRR